MIFFVILLGISAAIYLPFHEDINELTKSTAKLLQLKTQKRRSDRELRRNPPPSYEEILKEQITKKQLERQQEQIEWYNQFQQLLPLPPQTPLVRSRGRVREIDPPTLNVSHITSDRIIVTQHKSEVRNPQDELTYTQRFLRTGALVYRHPDQPTISRKLEPGTVITVLSWCENQDGHKFISIGKGEYVSVGSLHTRSTSGIPYIEMPKPPIIHENFDTFTMKTMDGSITQSYMTPTTPDVHSAKERCHRCEDQQNLYLKKTGA